MNSLLKLGLAAAIPLFQPVLKGHVTIPAEIGGGGIVIVEAEDPSFPLPVSAELSLKDGEEGTIDFFFDEQGIYTYVLYQKEGTEPFQITDPSVYVLEVRAAGKGEIESAFLYRDGSNHKTEKVFWQNRIRKQSPDTSDSMWAAGYAMTSFAALAIAAVLFRISGGRDEEEY